MLLLFVFYLYPPPGPIGEAAAASENENENELRRTNNDKEEDGKVAVRVVAVDSLSGGKPDPPSRVRWIRNVDWNYLSADTSAEALAKEECPTYCFA